jgi:WXXGXW repeat (2 copies)
MNEFRTCKSGGNHRYHPTSVASLISKYNGMRRRTLIRERDRLELRLHNNGPPGGLLPKESRQLRAVCGALTSGRIAQYLVAGVVFLVMVAVPLGTSFGLNQAAAAQRGQADSNDGVQVLTRGPVHEAFAETVDFDPEPGIVVSKTPPAAIEELPPEQRPAGANVAWIPGYWAWDDERSNFLWVSGIWRVLPPGRQWVAGYWGRSGQGSQWTSGYWANADVDEVEYLPEPPQSVEVGPSSEATSPDYSWAPGSWVWHQNRYAWRPGYWAEVQPDWVWVPAHYIWARRGYVFVDGYYDYAVNRRGVLFAPAYFDASVYSRRGFSYTPSIAIDLGLFTDHLFLRPNYGHYYFGDYYASSYQGLGFYPWFSYQSGGYGYDPFYAHYRWQHRRDRDWEHRIESDFGRRRDHEEARPPRTLADQTKLSASGVKSKDKSLVVATSLDQLSKSKDSPMKLQSVNKEERQKLATHGQEVNKFREERQKLETKTADKPDDKGSKKAEPAKMKLPKSPIVAQSADQLGKEHAPPKAHDAPKPDPKVEPKPRAAGGRPSREGKPTVTKVEPKPESPRAESKDKPKNESKEKPKTESGEKPRGESNDKPKGESKQKPQSDSKEQPQGQSKDKPKDKPKNQ